MRVEFEGNTYELVEEKEESNGVFEGCRGCDIRENYCSYVDVECFQLANPTTGAMKVWKLVTK